MQLASRYGRYGYRRVSALLRRDGWRVNHKRVERIWRLEGLKVPAKQPKRGRLWFTDGSCVRLRPQRQNHVWAYDFVALRTRDGRPVRLLTVVDWHSRKVLAWRVSVTMDTDFCVEALGESLGRHGAPEIFNTDQGSQFTSDAFTGLLKANGIQISMDGKGSWKDNVFVERLWKSVKYEEVYLRAYESVPEARTGLGRYFEFYNAGRPHSSLGGMTPDQFFDRAPAESAAA